ncbi:MAG: DUF4175 domain-containing protein [Planctomycetes bacterium]|nr:DUF4175 domain-containing protein [Planctomycetota bacterium]
MANDYRSTSGFLPQQTKKIDAKTTMQRGQGLLGGAQKHYSDVLKGKDSTTQQMMNKATEVGQAQKASSMGATQQRAQMAGLGGLAQQSLMDMKERAQETAQAERMGSIAQGLGQRQDQAAGQLAGMGQFEKQFGLQQEQYEKRDERQTIEDMIAMSDLTDPNAKAQLEEQYETTYGVKPTFEQLYNEKAKAKYNVAKQELDSFMLENEALMYDANGQLNPDFINNPQAEQALKKVWEAEGMSGQFDPKNSYYKDWAKDQFTKATTSQADLAQKKMMNTMMSNPAFGKLSSEQQDAAKEWIGLAAQGFGVNDFGQIVDSAGQIIAGDKTFTDTLGGESVTIVKGKDTITIGDNAYDFDPDDGVWEMPNGSEVTDPALKAMLDKHGKGWGDFEESAAKFKDFDTGNFSGTQFNKMLDDFDGSPEAIQALSDSIKDNPQNISPSAWDKLITTDSFKDIIKDAGEKVKLTATGTGSTAGNRKSFNTNYEVGKVYNINGTPSVITSGNEDIRWRMKGFGGGRYDYGQKISYKPLTGNDAGEVVTTSTRGM